MQGSCSAATGTVVAGVGINVAGGAGGVFPKEFRCKEIQKHEKGTKNQTKSKKEFVLFWICL